MNTVECFRCQGTGLFAGERPCYTCSGEGELDLDRVLYLRDRLIPDQQERYEATEHRYGFSPRQAEYQLEKLAEAYKVLQHSGGSKSKPDIKPFKRKVLLAKIRDIKNLASELEGALS